MLQQADINDKMRAILIDWLVEVHLKFKVRRDAQSSHQRQALALACHAASEDGRRTQC